VGINLLIPFLLLSGCSSVQFTNRGQIPVYVSKHKDHHDYLEIYGKKEFFLWGLIGDDKKVFIDEAFKDRGYVSVANVHIQTYMSAKAIFQTIFSLGLYVPKEYKIRGFGLTLDPELRSIKRREYLQ
jgi:hypothetical protein